MGKFMQKTLILAILIVSTLCFSSCSLNAEAKLKKIAPDVDYDFVLTYNFGEKLVINGTHYDLEDLAYNIFRKKATDRPIFTGKDVIGKYIYFQYTYSESNPFFPRGTNNRKWNVALLRTNVETAETTVLYDFKDARPIGLDTKYPYDVCNFVDDKSIFFFYNGNLMLYDLSTKTVTQTIDFYDEDRAISEDLTLDSVKVGELYCDFYYYAGDGIARYAEYRDGKIVDHKFKIDEDCVYNNEDATQTLRLGRVENYVYDYKHINNEVRFFNCFDLVSGEDLGGEFVENFLKERREERERQEREESARRENEEASEAEEKDDRYLINSNGKDYYYRFDRHSVEIEDKEGNALYSVNSEYAQAHSKKYTELFRLYYDNVWAEIDCAESYENRLFISFSNSILMWWRTPRMIFEFDLETGDMKYLTYVDSYVGYYIYSITPKS